MKNISIYQILGILLTVVGIVLLSLSFLIPWAYLSEANCWEDEFYIYCFGTRPNLDAPINGLPYVILAISGAVILNSTIIARSILLLSEEKRKASFVVLLLGGLFLIIPIFFTFFVTFSVGWGFFIYLLSLIPIIGSSRLLKISKDMVTPKQKIKRRKFICIKCGAKLAPGYSICLKCGEKIQIEEE